MPSVNACTCNQSFDASRICTSVSITCDSQHIALMGDPSSICHGRKIMHFGRRAAQSSSHTVQHCCACQPSTAPNPQLLIQKCELTSCTTWLSHRTVSLQNPLTQLQNALIVTHAAAERTHCYTCSSRMHSLLTARQMRCICGRLPAAASQAMLHHRPREEEKKKSRRRPGPAATHTTGNTSCLLS